MLVRTGNKCWSEEETSVSQSGADTIVSQSQEETGVSQKRRQVLVISGDKC